MTVSTDPYKKHLFVRRSTDSAGKTDTSLVADTQLLVPVVAGGLYTFKAFIKYDASQLGDIAVAFSIPAGTGPVVEWVGYGLTASTAGGGTGSVQDTETSGSGAQRPFAGGNIGTKMGLVVHGIAVVPADASAGNLTLLWAQNGTDAANPTTVYANSYLEAFMVA